jgi:hypothetical protein
MSPAAMKTASDFFALKGRVGSNPTAPVWSMDQVTTA